jgi:hypothetical protein
MDYTISSDLWTSIIPLSLAIGAVGGFIWDVGNAIRKSTRDVSTGLDNIITLPSFHHPRGKSWYIELGLLGPIAVGAVAGLLVVLLVGRTGPSTEEVTPQLLTVAQATPTTNSPGQGAGANGQGAQGSPQQSQQEEVADAAEALTTTTIDRDFLVVLALIGGLGGWALLQTITTRSSQLLEAAVGAVIGPAGDAAAQTVQQKAAQLGIPNDQQEQLVVAARDAVSEQSETLLRP